MWIVSLDRHPGDACHSRDIHLHTRPPGTNNCEAHWGSRWKGNVSIGTLNMPHNIVEWHLRFQMNVTRRMEAIHTWRTSKHEDHPNRKGHPSVYGKPTPHRGSAETKTYRYRRIGWEGNLPLPAEQPETTPPGGQSALPGHRRQSSSSCEPCRPALTWQAGSPDPSASPS